MKRRVARSRWIVLLALSLVPGALFGARAAGQPSPALSGADDDGKPVIARVYFETRDHLADLAATLDVWEVHHPLGYLVAYVDRERIDSLRAEGVRVEIDPEFTERVHRPRAVSPDQAAGIPGYPCYRTVEETFAALNNLLAQYPTLVTKTDIGNSWDKATGGGPAGYDIWELTLTNSAIAGTKPRFMLIAEAHAREYVTAEVALRFAEYLLSHYDTDPDVTWLLDRFELHLIPMVNPDGRKFAEQGYYWRKNTNTNECSASDYGVDPNRNCAFHWGGSGASTYPCDETYRGTASASEPETQAVQNYVLGIFPDRRGPADGDAAPTDYEGLFITLHSYSELVLWPWGWGYGGAPNETALQTLGRKLAYFNDYTPEQSSDLYLTSGTHDDYAYGTLGVPSYTFEMGTDFFQNCSYFESTIWPDNRDALAWAFKSARRPYLSPSAPDSLSLAVNPPSVPAGTPATLTATANDTRYRSGYGEPAHVVNAARYSIDAPSWVAGTPTYPMAAADGSFNSTVENVTAALDTSGLAPGRHSVFVESKDASGNWGVPSAVFLAVTVVPPCAERVVNGSFEEAGANANEAVAWTNNANIGSSEGRQPYGTGKYFFRMLGDYNSMPNQATQTIAVSGTLPKTLRLSMYQWSNPGSAGAVAYKAVLKVKHADGTAKSWALNLPQGDSGGWKKVRTCVSPTKNYTSAAVTLVYTHAKGIVKFDNVSLLECSQDCADVESAGFVPAEEEPRAEDDGADAWE